MYSRRVFVPPILARNCAIPYFKIYNSNKFDEINLEYMFNKTITKYLAYVLIFPASNEEYLDAYDHGTRISIRCTYQNFYCSKFLLLS